LQEIEVLLANEIKLDRKKGIGVTTKWVKKRAKQLAAKKNLFSFKASNGWVYRFRKRNSFVNRRASRSTSSVGRYADYQVMMFWRNLIRLRQKMEYKLDYIGNIDQTRCYFDMSYNLTWEERGAKNVKIKNSGSDKDGFTVTLGGTATGRKFLPQIVFKGKRQPKTTSKNVIVCVSETAWSSHSLVIDFFKNNNIRKELGYKKPFLMIVDSWEGYNHESVKKFCEKANIQLYFIPPGLTGKLQPMDTHVNKLFKNHVRELWENWTRETMNNLEASGKDLRLPRPSKQKIVEWIDIAWKRIPNDLIKKSFLQNGISNALDGSEDDLCTVKLTGDPSIPPTNNDSSSEEDEEQEEE
jgi:hypothetical protein